MIVFVDTSALGAAHLGDEADGEWIARVLLEGVDPEVVCELADVELASLLALARRDGRIDAAGMEERLARYAAHTSDGGPIGVVPLTGATVRAARQMVLEAPVRTLDALHLAAARQLAEASADPIELLTLDDRQADAAAALGLPLFRRPA